MNGDNSLSAAFFLLSRRRLAEDKLRLAEAKAEARRRLNWRNYAKAEVAEATGDLEPTKKISNANGGR